MHEVLTNFLIFLDDSIKRNYGLSVDAALDGDLNLSNVALIFHENYKFFKHQLRKHFTLTTHQDVESFDKQKRKIAHNKAFEHQMDFVNKKFRGTRFNEREWANVVAKSLDIAQVFDRLPFAYLEENNTDENIRNNNIPLY